MDADMFVGGGTPRIMVFRPTWDEFKDFNKYILYMESCGAHKAGLAKIVPPPEWKPRASGYDMDSIGDIVIPAPICQVVTGKQGLYQQINVQKKAMTVREFKKCADSNDYQTPRHFDYEDLERKFWKNITYNSPIYGADVSGSLTDATVKEWNINKLGSILDYVNEDYGISIEGVNTAYLYFGMWKTTFAWHTEDMDLYSINYLHFGAPKSWYCIPPDHGKRLERLADGFFFSSYKECPAYLRHKMTLISPQVLKSYSIPFGKITQEAGEFMVTFPYGYHAGFNHGFNCAESTNFASERWVEYGKRATQCLCREDMVRISMDTFVKRFQPDKYELWIQGRDVGPHPENPTRQSAANAPTVDDILCNKNNTTIPDSYFNAPSKKLKRHLIHKKKDPDGVEAKDGDNEKEKQVEPESQVCCDVEEPVDEEVEEVMKDIWYKAGEMDDDFSPEKKKKKNPKNRKLGVKDPDVKVKSGKSECSKKDKSVRRKTHDIVQNVVLSKEGIPLTSTHAAKPSTSTASCAIQSTVLDVKKVSIPVFNTNFNKSYKIPKKIATEPDMSTLESSHLISGPMATYSRPKVMQQQKHRMSEAIVHKSDGNNHAEPPDRSADLSASFSRSEADNRLNGGQNAVHAVKCEMEHDWSVVAGSSQQQEEPARAVKIEVKTEGVRRQSFQASESSSISPGQTCAVDSPDNVEANAGGSGSSQPRNYRNAAKDRWTGGRTVPSAGSFVELLTGVCGPDEGNSAQVFSSTRDHSQDEQDGPFPRRQNEYLPMHRLTATIPGRRRSDLRECIDSPEILSGIWLQQSKWTFDQEAEFNLFSSLYEPYCCVCSLMSPLRADHMSFESGQWKQKFFSQPSASEVMISEECFSTPENMCADSANGKSKSREMSQLLRCSSCRVCVHMKCYGVSDHVSPLNWLCRRCQRSDDAAVCVLCNRKGGALKPTSDGRWAHIVCALCIPEVVFEHVTAREPVNVANNISENRLGLSCTFCEKQYNNLVFYRGICVQCSSKECSCAFHVTCGVLAGARFTTVAPFNISCTCPRHSSNRRNLSSHQLAAGSRVIAKHTNGNYYEAVMTEPACDASYYWVDFSDGSTSKDTFPEDILNYRCIEEGPPPLGAAVRVMWTDGKCYDGIFRGCKLEKIYKLVFWDETTVSVKRCEFYTSSEVLPKRVKDRLGHSFRQQQQQQHFYHGAEPYEVQKKSYIRERKIDHS